jgi:hypothetical protein
VVFRAGRRVQTLATPERRGWTKVGFSALKVGPGPPCVWHKWRIATRARRPRHTGRLSYKTADLQRQESLLAFGRFGTEWLRDGTRWWSSRVSLATVSGIASAWTARVPPGADRSHVSRCDVLSRRTGRGEIAIRSALPHVDILISGHYLFHIGLSECLTMPCGPIRRLRRGLAGIADGRCFLRSFRCLPRR